MTLEQLLQQIDDFVAQNPNPVMGASGWSFDGLVDDVLVNIVLSAMLTSDMPNEDKPDPVVAWTLVKFLLFKDGEVINMLPGPWLDIVGMNTRRNPPTGPHRISGIRYQLARERRPLDNERKSIREKTRKLLDNDDEHIIRELNNHNNVKRMARYSSFNAVNNVFEGLLEETIYVYDASEILLEKYETKKYDEDGLQVGPSHVVEFFRQGDSIVTKEYDQ